MSEFDCGSDSVYALDEDEAYAIIAFIKNHEREDIPDDVCVLVYNKAFECTRMRELADMFPDLADHLMAIRENVADLLAPFRSGCYYLPSMGGSFSIKSVLPALYWSPISRQMI